MAGARAGVGRRLYVVEGTGGDERLDPANAPDYLLADRWRLLALHPVTLAPEGEYPLGEAPRSLAVAPDGDHAYALAGPVHLGLPSTVLHLDLRTGAVRRLLAVPGSGVGGLALAGGYLFVPDPEGGAVSVVDPRSATVVRTTRVGGALLAIAAGSSWPRARDRRGRPRAGRRRPDSPLRLPITRRESGGSCGTLGERRETLPDGAGRWGTLRDGARLLRKQQAVGSNPTIGSPVPD